MSQPENDKRIDYVEFAATDLEAIKKFYTTVFDWQFEDYGPAYTSFQDGRLNGGFYQVDAVPQSSPLIVLYATDLEGTMKRVTEAGGKIVKEIFSFPGGRRFHFADPSGNELAVWADPVA